MNSKSINQFAVRDTARPGRGKSAFLTLLALAALSSNALAVDYTWTDAAGDGDWNNEVN